MRMQKFATMIFFKLGDPNIMCQCTDLLVCGFLKIQKDIRQNVLIVNAYIF
jgi:hypothetical protein